jgi:mannitol-1-phosphate 5-dehydrogenase
MRKLAPDDRLVGAARLVEKHGGQPKALAWGIAAALAFDDADDPHAVELQSRIEREGLDRVMENLCAIRPDEPLGELVRACYTSLQTDPKWKK